MGRSLLFAFCGLVFLAWNAVASTNEIFLPAGTLLRCTLDEPNFSSQTAEVGDPVLCRVNAAPQFGRAAFPQGAYLVGRLEDYRDPGRFVGKGYLRLKFDRIALPDADLLVSGKVISVRGFRVNRHGDIVGRGHPKRDLVQWLLPPLWPWKIVSLPARGPRPALKDEVPITLRLMDALVVPKIAASPWRSFGRPSARGSSLQSFTAPSSSSVRYVPYEMLAQPPAREQSVKLTLFALRDQTIYGAADYWIDNGGLTFILSDGTQKTADLDDIDWGRTTQLNSERGVRVALRTGPHPY